MLKITGLKKIASESKCLRGCYDPLYYQINYNVETGEAWYSEHYDLGHSWQVIHNDSNIINCGNIHHPHTMKELREMIEHAVERRKEEEEWRKADEAYYAAKAAEKNEAEYYG